MVKPIAIDCCHFIKRKVIVCLDIKVGSSNRMMLAPILITELGNRAKRTRFFIPKEKWPQNSPELNSMDYSICAKISSHMEHGKIKTINNLSREIEKAIKIIDIYYVREMIGAFLRRVHSMVKHDGELVINKYS